MLARRVIAFCGLADADVAALRPLIRRAAELSDESWAIGTDDNADLVVLDLQSDSGLLAQARAAERKRLWVAIDSDTDDGLLLSRPFELDGLMQLLVSATERLPKGVSSVIGGSRQFGLEMRDDNLTLTHSGVSMSDFLADDLLGCIPDARPSVDTTAAVSDMAGGNRFSIDRIAAALLGGAIPSGKAGSSIPSAAASAVSTTEALPEPKPQPAAAPVVVLKTDTTGVAATPAIAIPAPVVAPPRAHYPLVEYLGGKLIGLPSRVVVDGSAPMVIDPIAKCFHAIGDLKALEPYLDTLLARTQWSALLPSQLAAVRKEIPGRPFDLLRWYYALRSQPQRLAPHLDPGGTYRLRSSLNLTVDHPRAARIAGAMSVTRGLAEIASLSATSVNEVYGVVSAFDSIGCLEWQPRARPSPSGART